jgi:hypothetical protein
MAAFYFSAGQIDRHHVLKFAPRFLIFRPVFKNETLSSSFLFSFQNESTTSSAPHYWTFLFHATPPRSQRTDYHGQSVLIVANFASLRGKCPVVWFGTLTETVLFYVAGTRQPA